MTAESAALSALQAFIPVVPWLTGLGGFWILVACPMPGRGPGFFRRRDPWRGFKFAARAAVMTRAGNRCEGSIVLAWGRCRQVAVEVDHVYPWCKGGPTVVSNGQALCREHNRRKSSMTPPWWYVLSLERRRRGYFSDVSEVKVMASMNSAERDARAAWVVSRATRRSTTRG